MVLVEHTNGFGVNRGSGGNGFPMFFVTGDPPCSCFHTAGGSCRLSAGVRSSVRSDPHWMLYGTKSEVPSTLPYPSAHSGWREKYLEGFYYTVRILGICSRITKALGDKKLGNTKPLQPNEGSQGGFEHECSPEDESFTTTL